MKLIRVDLEITLNRFKHEFNKKFLKQMVLGTYSSIYSTMAID